MTRLRNAVEPPPYTWERDSFNLTIYPSGDCLTVLLGAVVGPYSVHLSLRVSRSSMTMVLRLSYTTEDGALSGWS